MSGSPGTSPRPPARVILVLADLAAAARRTLVALPGRMMRRWRSSLQVRVVTTTLVTSAAVVTILGFSLAQQIANGLQQELEQQASNQVREGLSIAQTQPGVSASLNGGTGQLMLNIVNSLKSGEPGASNSFGVAVMLPLRQCGQPVYLCGWYDGLQVGDLPTSLVKEVAGGRCSGQVTTCFVPATMPFAGSAAIPGLVFGAPFGYSNYYQLYYFFPLTQVQQTISLVERTLVLAGLALVFLLAGIAALVTRWVVVPVARAAQIARRLSAGNLAERLEVRGTDELAALGRSFNEMGQSLQEKVAELEELSAVQRQFVSDVSHELRTPLTTIRMAGDLLFEARNQLDSSSARSAELLHGQLGRFESLLGDLLEISRFDANAATLEAEPADMCDLVRQSADVAQQLAERRGARIEFRLPADPCVADVDRRRVERILRNLLVNAVEHGEGKDVVVTAACDRDAVAVAVRDYGVGLAPGEEFLVFDRFWRADPARARSTGGTGLGLAIALEDARLHGGWLEAWGEAGLGSVFRLTLPRTSGAALAGSPLPLGPDQADLARVPELPDPGSAPGLDGPQAGGAGAEPALDGAGPALEDAGPALEGAGPALEGAGPALEGAGPALEGAAPGWDGAAAGAHGAGGAAADQSSSDKGAGIRPPAAEPGRSSGHG